MGKLVQHARDVGLPGAPGRRPSMVVLVQPAIAGIGLARFVPPVPGDGGGRLASRDLQPGRRPFAQVGARLVGPQVEPGGPLRAGEC